MSTMHQAIAPALCFWCSEEEDSQLPGANKALEHICKVEPIKFLDFF